MSIDSTSQTTESGVDPRNIFLSPAEIFERYRWGRSRGYVLVKGLEMHVHPVCGGFRLDLLWQYEERVSDGTLPGPEKSIPQAKPQIPKSRRRTKSEDDK